MADEYRVMAIKAVLGGGTTFVLAQNAADPLLLTSTSAQVQAAALAGFLSGGKMVFETEGKTSVVRRVAPFATGTGYIGDLSKYRVARLATQRGPDGADHLEVFLTPTNDSNEIAYNVFDPLLQQLLLAAFLHHAPGMDVGLDVVLEDKNLVGVSLGRY